MCDALTGGRTLPGAGPGHHPFPPAVAPCHNARESRETLLNPILSGRPWAGLSGQLCIRRGQNHTVYIYQRGTHGGRAEHTPLHGQGRPARRSLPEAAVTEL